MNPLENENQEINKKISRDVIDYLLKNPEISLGKITSIKARIGKKYHHS